MSSIRRKGEPVEYPIKPPVAVTLSSKIRCTRMNVSLDSDVQRGSNLPRRCGRGVGTKAR